MPGLHSLTEYNNRSIGTGENIMIMTYSDVVESYTYFDTSENTITIPHYNAEIDRAQINSTQYRT